MWYAITSACPDFDCGLAKPPLKLGRGVSNYTLLFYVAIITYQCSGTDAGSSEVKGSKDFPYNGNYNKK